MDIKRKRNKIYHPIDKLVVEIEYLRPLNPSDVNMLLERLDKMLFETFKGIKVGNMAKIKIWDVKGTIFTKRQQNI